MSTVVEPLGALHRPDRTTTVRAASNPVRADRLSGLVDLVFRNTVAAPVWLVVRVWLGYEWLSAGMEKLSAHGAASWFGHAPALAGFVHGADAAWANRAKAFGHPAVHYAWFLDFLHFVAGHGALFGPLVVFSEILIGLGLITGTCTRWAAIGAVALNLMYICGGSAGVNGVFLVTEVLLIGAWRVAGHIGGDGVIRNLRHGQLQYQ
jgi:thiosulfate dehydrogenase [quinone] large subunit